MSCTKSSTYIDNGDFSAISSPDNHKAFIIGRTGSGKSALFAYLKQQKPGKVIQIRPENLMFRYIINLDAIDYLSTIGVRLDIFFKALWKHIIIIETLRHHYKLDSPSRRAIAWAHFLDILNRYNPRKRAVDYVTKYEDHFFTTVQKICSPHLAGLNQQ